MTAWWSQFWGAMRADIGDLPDGAHVGHLVGRMLVAAVLGGVLGYERGQKGKAAGMRTHMLVAMAAALFVVVSQQAGMPTGDLSRVIQGVAAGMGFIGAGAIVKQSGAAGNVQGLTTAASLWLTTAVGIAAGFGREASAVLGTVLAVVVLTFLPSAVQRLGGDGEREGANGGGCDKT